MKLMIENKKNEKDVVNEGFSVVNGCFSVVNKIDLFQ
jgi:hypothetical protein